MARTRIREQQVLDTDFESEDEATQRLNAHVNAFAHAPVAVAPADTNLYLKFDGTNYTWSAAVAGGSIIPDPDPIADDQKILRYDGPSDTVNWIDQAEIQTIALPYHWDATRNKFLGNELIRVMFSRYGTNKRNTYMYYADRISSNSVPFKLREDWTTTDFCLVSADWTTSDSNSGTNIIKVQDKNDGNYTIWQMDLANSTKDEYFGDLDVDVWGDSWMRVRINGTTVSNSVLVLGIRQVYVPA